MTVKKRGRAVETRRSVRIFRLPAGPGGCAIILGPKKGGVKKGRVGLSKRLAFSTFFLPQGVPHTKMKTKKRRLQKRAGPVDRRDIEMSVFWT